MASIERTAYPRLNQRLSDEELRTHYELTDGEQRFVSANAHGDRQRLTLAVMLKIRQRLGYFPSLRAVPHQIVEDLARQLGFPDRIRLLDTPHLRTTWHRYRRAIQDFLGSQPYGPEHRPRVERAILKAAETMSDPADLINVAVEELTKAGIELPAFSTLARLASNLRQQVHEALYARITRALTAAQKGRLDELLTVPAGRQVTGFHLLKKTPGPPTLNHIREWAAHLEQLDGLLDPKPFLRDIPHTKVRQFAAEATALEVGDLRDIRGEGKRHALLLCLLHHAQSTTRDELIEMFLRRMKKTHDTAQQHLSLLREQHRELEEALIAVLGKVLHEAKEAPSDEAFGQGIRRLLADRGGAEAWQARYEAVSAYHQNNDLPLLWPVHARYRTVLFRLLDLLRMESATQDTALLEALAFVRQHQQARRDTLPSALDLTFVSQRWQTFVRAREGGETALDRRALEVCVLTHLAKALRRGDVYVEGSQAYADYREQLLPWDQCRERLPEYCRAVGLPEDGTAFVASLKQRLTQWSHQVDAGFPDNAELTIDPDGKPHLKQQKKTPLPDGLAAFETAVQTRMPERHLLDVLNNVQCWTGYTRHFGPPSGSDPKLPEATRQYLFAVFGYGCNLGASQTANHVPEAINRHTLRRINAQHVSVAKLEAAMNDVIAEYARFELPRFWGDGKTAIADGTHIELRENNLLGSRHIRYGGYGGIAYHHISDRYIALFCNFIACGVWEAVYILDGLLKNRSEIQPDTLHADTQGQSEAVFGIAHLLGIKLMPRMRTWNDVIFYRPDKHTVYQHVGPLFSETVDWKLIETHWQDMMQVVLSIQAGQVLPSMLLRKLGVHNKKNKLYRAVRELGRVERTLFLLRYISISELRQTIRAETTKIESYNDFLDWITFGGPMIKSGDPVEQTKRIKYMNLVANAIMLQNVVDLTEVLNEMIQEGFEVTPALIGRLSPCLRRHLLRFGRYVLNEDLPAPLQPKSIQIAA